MKYKNIIFAEWAGILVSNMAMFFDVPLCGNVYMD